MNQKKQKTEESSAQVKASAVSKPRILVKKIGTYIERPNDLRTSSGRADAYKSLAVQICHDVSQMREDSLGQVILVLHALELALKAYLIHAGLNEEQLSRRPFSHNLNNAYLEAKKRGLQIIVGKDLEPHDIILRHSDFHGDKTDRLIQWASQLHDRGLLRYELRDVSLPTCIDLLPIIRAVLEAIPDPNITPVNAARHQHRLRAIPESGPPNDA
jgi:hypothetical protein